MNFAEVVGVEKRKTLLISSHHLNVQGGLVLNGDAQGLDHKDGTVLFLTLNIKIY